MSAPTPTPEMTRKAREAAEQAAAEHGVPIDRTCVRVEARTGQLDVIVLGKE
jgi:hypothetical protein